MFKFKKRLALVVAAVGIGICFPAQGKQHLTMEYRELRVGGMHALEEALPYAVKKGYTHVGIFNNTDMVETAIKKIHDAGLEAVAGSHGFSDFLPEGKCKKDTVVTMAGSCLEQYLSAYTAWANGPAREADILRVWPNDGRAPFAVPRGSTPSDEYLRIVMAVKRLLPGRRLMYLAYSSYTEPPKRVVPHDIVVEFAPFKRTHFQSIKVGANTPIFLQLQKWRRVHSGTLVIFDYWPRGYWIALDIPVWIPKVMRTDMGVLSEAGIDGASGYYVKRGHESVLEKTMDYYSELLFNPSAKIPHSNFLDIMSKISAKMHPERMQIIFGSNPIARKEMSELISSAENAAIGPDLSSIKKLKILRKLVEDNR